MRVVLAPVGSLGDLHPFIALACALRAHHIDPLIATAVDYQDKVERAGVSFAPMRPGYADLERRLGLDRATLIRRAIEAPDFVLRELVVPFVRASFEDLEAVCGDADLVVTSTLAFGARLVAEKRGLPWWAVVLQPFMFVSAHDPPVIPGAAWLGPLLRRLGPRPARWTLALLRRALGPSLAGVQRVRAELGLPPTTHNPLLEGAYSSLGAIGLYPDLLGPVRPDYPRPTHLVGFARYDSADGAAPALEPALTGFLAAGPAPLVFTLGSTIVQSPGGFFEASAAAARTLGRRAVLLVGEEDHAYRKLAGTEVFVGRYAPYSLLFPHAELIVHQGGIGTLAQALAAGRPQLIVPHFADQLDNAARAVRLGVAHRITPLRYRRRAVEALAAVLGDTRLARAASSARERVLHVDGAAVAARLIATRLGIPERTRDRLEWPPHCRPGAGSR